MGRAARRKRERKAADVGNDGELYAGELAHDYVRLRFEDHDLGIVIRPALPLQNPAYVEALVEAGAPHELSIALLVEGKKPSGAEPLSEKTAVGVLAWVYARSVVDRLERLEGDVPVPDAEEFLTANPDVLLDVVSYATNLGTFMGTDGGQR